MSSVPTPPTAEVVLTSADEQRLAAAHRRLRQAVEEYEPLVGEPRRGSTVSVHPADQVAREQDAVETAERELWALREELLGWERPSWAPSAAFTADWFSDEDSVYDKPSSTSRR